MSRVSPRGVLREQLAQRVEMHRRAQRGVTGCGLAYSCIEEMVLRHGRFYEPRSLGRDYPYRTPKQCFRNAYDLASESAGAMRYVEGYALMDVAPLATEHAWCLDEENRVVDPTWPQPARAYLGVAFPISVVRAIVLARGRYGAFGDHRDVRTVLGAPLDIASLITEAQEAPDADPFAARTAEPLEI